MSNVETELDYRLWNEYLLWCRAESEHLGAPITPDIKSYLVWLGDQDYDESL